MEYVCSSFYTPLVSRAIMDKTPTEVAVSTEGDADALKAVPFRDAATQVISDLRLALRAVIADLPGLAKPADMQKALKLDQTLCWQLFRIIGHGDVLVSGSAVPSRTSLERFSKAAKARGVAAAKLQQLIKTHEAFEGLIEVHAGDRVTFNSMVSAAASIEEEWLATDLQHRRNMFRGLSHSMGMRTKTRLQLTIVKDSPTEQLSDFVMITGVVDLRNLREFPRMRVYGMMSEKQNPVTPQRRPLFDKPDGTGFLLSDFSTQLTSELKMSETHTPTGSLFEATLESPTVGKLGSKNLMFGEVWERYPFELPRSWNTIITSPIETVINDMLIMPGSLKGLKPVADVTWTVAGKPDGRGGRPIRGQFAVEHLGTGPDALATPDVPNYPAMVRDAVAPLGWDVDAAIAVRIRVEYPIYMTNVTMRWEPAEAAE